MNYQSQARVLRVAVLALSIFAFTVFLNGCGKKADQEPSTEPVLTIGQEISSEPAIPQDAVKYDGEYFVPKKGLQTILIMGLDKYERPEASIAYTNTMQSDFLLLAVIDEGAGQCELLHLNRDTMTEIQRLGFGGADTGKFVGQLALAHTYGSGGSDSCLNAVKAVSHLLGGVKIDHYMTLTMDGVGKINDLVGGVTVTMLEDFSELDPAMKKGETVTLKGEQALLYVRTRQGIGDQSNLSRMERQRQYLEAFYGKLMEANRKIDGFLSSSLLKVNDDFESDCTVNQLDALSDVLETCEVNPIRTIDGQAVQGEEFMEFYVNEESLQETIIRLFYEKW